MLRCVSNPCCGAALHVRAAAGLPVHLPVGAHRQGVHQRCSLPRHRVAAPEHAGPAARAPHRELCPV